MASFRFRAQAALDLRRREHDAAQRDVARAEAEREQASAAVAVADASLASARRAADDAALTTGAHVTAQWYRSWILRLLHERTALAAIVRGHDERVARARARCAEARQRHEALVRFREKAIDVHAAAAADAERKLIDELATRRFAVRRGPIEGVRP